MTNPKDLKIYEKATLRGLHTCQNVKKRMSLNLLH